MEPKNNLHGTFPQRSCLVLKKITSWDHSRTFCDFRARAVLELQNPYSIFKALITFCAKKGCMPSSEH